MKLGKTFDDTKSFDSDNIDYNRYSSISITFSICGDAINWAKSNTLKNGFELIISSHKNNDHARILKVIVMTNIEV